MNPMLEHETILPYCVFAAAGYSKAERLLGIDNKPVAVVTRNGLSAAVSRIAAPNAAVDSNRLLRFCIVVESLHRGRAVIPMRYGSWFQDESQLLSFLDEHSSEFHTLLREIGSGTEISLRLLLPRADSSDGCVSDPLPPSAALPLCKGENGIGIVSHAITNSGRSYLMARKAALEPASGKDEETIAEIVRSFEGLFVRHKREDRLLPECHLVSLHFLVSRASVKTFAKAFQEIARHQRVKLLMTGPWAPYNFVQADSARSQEGFPYVEIQSTARQAE